MGGEMLARVQWTYIQDMRTDAWRAQPRRRIRHQVLPPGDVAAARHNGAARVLDEAAHDQVCARVLCVASLRASDCMRHPRQDMCTHRRLNSLRELAVAVVHHHNDVRPLLLQSRYRPPNLMTRQRRTHGVTPAALDEHHSEGRGRESE